MGERDVSLVWSAGAGLLATLVMTLVMAVGVSTGLAPMPEPIPLALAELVLPNAAKPALMIVGMVAHFLYGALAGVVFAALFRRWLTYVSGMLWGIVLWLVMQLVVLPLLGWGVFGVSVTPKIALATGVLHLLYGAVLGGFLQGATSRETHEAREPEAS